MHPQNREQARKEQFPISAGSAVLMCPFPAGEDEDALCNTPNTRLKRLPQSKSVPVLRGGVEGERFAERELEL